jgi:hypothetical protein
MDPEIARNQDYDDHYANDGEDVHSVPLHSMMMGRCACTPHIRPISASAMDDLGSAEAAKQSPCHRYRHRLYPQ